MRIRLEMVVEINEQRISKAAEIEVDLHEFAAWGSTINPLTEHLRDVLSDWKNDGSDNRPQH